MTMVQCKSLYKSFNVETLPGIEHGRISKRFCDVLTSTIQHCIKVKDTSYALHLYEYTQKQGIESHRSLGNHLVSMLVEVGRICDARQVFDRLVYRSESSWNSMILGYVKCGELHHALALYSHLQSDEYVQLSGHVFVSLLRSSSKLKDLELGVELHSVIARLGFLEKDVFIGSALVGMYAKSGLFSRAQEVLHDFPAQNIVMWNSLLSGYIEFGHNQDVICCFEQMKLQGIYPDGVTLVCILKACGNLVATCKGREIHAIAQALGLLQDNIFVGNSVIDMYAKGGSLIMAQQVFDRLLVHDGVSWNALIVGYADHGHNEEALDRFEQMQGDGILPDAITFVCILKSCGEIGTIDKCHKILAEIERLGLVEKNLFVSGAMINMYAKCGLIVNAREVFNRIQVRDTVLWNSLMTGYAEHGYSEEMLDCLEQMHIESTVSDVVTFVCGLKASSDLRDLRKGKEIHAVVQKKCLEENVLIGNALVEMYAKCNCLDMAQQVFDNLPIQDTISCNALIAGYAEHGKGEESLKCLQRMQDKHIPMDAVTFVWSLKVCGNLCAREQTHELHLEIERHGLLERDIGVGNGLIDTYARCGLLGLAQQVFDKMPSRDTISWNVLIAGYVDHGLSEEAFKCFDEMQSEGISANAVTFVAILKACCSMGALDRARNIHLVIEHEGLLQNDIVLGNTLLNMYAKCGLVAKAQQVFDMLPVRDVTSWTTLMVGYAHIGECDSVFLLFDSMLLQGIKPNMVTFLVALNACSRTGQLRKSQQYFEAMKTEYGMCPTLEHHTCIMDLLVRSGQLENAGAMIKKIPFSSDPVVWHSILDACKTWGNVELGKQAFENALHLNQDDAVAYVLMSQIYSRAGLDAEAHKLKMMNVTSECSYSSTI